MQRRPVTVAGVLFILFSGPAFAQTATLQQAGAAVGRYCATCHNAKLKTAGVVLDPAVLSNAHANAEVWEKAIRQLRAGSMPPPGAPRPGQDTYDGVAAFLENHLDRAAATQQRPGKLPLLHRLTRTEYANAVRDVLALEALPKEMDFSLLLPPDNASSGFDNIADLLFVSPTAMQRYLAAAEKVSRLAMGDPTAPVLVNVHRMPDEQPQTARVDALPIGTRGGLAVRSHYPLDGEYVIKVTFAGRSPERQTLEISVDGERTQLARIESNEGLRFGAFVRPMEFRVPIKAGPRLVGVTFLERNELRDESVLRPRMRGTGPELAVEVVTISGPFNATGPGDTPSRRRIFACRPASANDEETCALTIFTALARRAFRRPVSPADVQPLMPFFTAGRKEGGFELGVQRGIQRMLVSPQFLFRIERDPAGAAPGSIHPISDLELASRLSFFLWSSIPDEELLDLASRGELRQPGRLERQVQRMLSDPRSTSLVTNFAEQWLFLRDLDEKKPNEVLFPDFDESLRDAYRQETRMFLDSVLRSKASVLDLLSANYTFVNERLAKHYGIPNVKGSGFRQVALPEGSPRGGLLGQGSILTITSYANRTSPVSRGKWVLENLLSSPPPPPPADVPALRTEARNSNKPMTMREAMIQHRENPACFSCHSRMDPIGFAMENFDAVGRWRDRDAGVSIDASGVFPNGATFGGLPGLKQTLLSSPDEFVSTVVEKLLMYAVGRNVQYFDRPVIRRIVRDGRAGNYTFASLVLGVVNSVPFQMREVDLASAVSAQKSMVRGE